MRELMVTRAALDLVAKGQDKSMAAYTSRLIAHWIKKSEKPHGSADQPAQPTPFVTASLNSHFFDTQWGQQQGVWQPDLGQGLAVSLWMILRIGRAHTDARLMCGVAQDGDGLGAYPFFNQIVNPQSIEQEVMYPPLDDRLW